ncbi:MAG: regulatory protein RecX [Micromonosporaceae bacterium]
MAGRGRSPSGRRRGADRGSATGGRGTRAGGGRTGGGSPTGGTRGASTAGGMGARSTGSGGPPADPREAARGICLRLLAVRPRTRAELATALGRRGIPEEIAEVVLERFSEVGLIDDAAFADAWVASRHHGRGLARRALGHELRRRGIDGSTVHDALEQLDSDTEEETARTLVERRLRTLSGAAPEVAFRRLAGMLARKGYPAGLALRVVREALATRPDAADFVDAAGPDLDAFGDIAEAESAAASDTERYGSPH